MKSEIHGINCDCCETKSQEAKELLNEINSILEELGPTNIVSPKKAVIQKSKEVQELFSKTISIDEYSEYPEIPIEERFAGSVDNLGKIGELTKLIEKLFSLPDGDVNFDAVKLTDPEKKIGKFKVKEISENPNIDLTKILDLNGVNLDAFSKLKIAVTIPTIDAVLGFKFGPIELGINFKIGIGTYSWAPAFKFDTPEQALENLKGMTYKKLVTESGPEDLEELKSLAETQFAKVPSVKFGLKLANDKQEFFEQANRLGVNLMKDVDVEQEALAIVENEKRIKEINSLAGLPNSENAVLSQVGVAASGSADSIQPGLPEPENTVPSQIGASIKNCADVTPQPAVYREEEIQKVHDQTCKIDSGGANIGGGADGIGTGEGDGSGANNGDSGGADGGGSLGPGVTSGSKPVELTYPNTELPSSESELNNVQDVLSEVDGHSQEMQNCAKQKIDASNKWYAFYSHAILHKITVRYFDLMRDHIDFFKSQLFDIIRDRDAVVANYTNSTLSNGVYQDSQQFLIDAALANNATNTELLNVETRFNAFREDLNNTIDSSIPSLDIIRLTLSMEINPLSNLLGYSLNSQFSEWSIKTPEQIALRASDGTYNIAGRCKELWEASIETPSQYDGGTKTGGEITGVFGPLNNYIIPLDLPQYSGETLIKDRQGLFEVGIWKPFNSAKRIDYFFTYQEQGYSAPKPQYNDNGELVGGTVNKVIKNGLEEEIIVETPAASQNLMIDDDVAQAFWENLETLTRERVEQKVAEIENSSAYTNYINNVLDQAAKKEAALVFYQNIQNRGFLEGLISLYSLSNSEVFARNAFVARTYYEKLLEELAFLEDVMTNCQICVEEKKLDIENTVKKLLGNSSGGDSTNLEKECKEKLGSDPVGQNPSDGRCPTYVKNCYWKEYTKILQKVSLMPIPELDPQNFSVRLFRYYPVAIQFPIPPIPAIPTLALGIPDPLVSIPLPLLWKHIITINTPIGTIVTWIALAGFIPSPFIMLIDEKGEATFMLTSRGPCSIPHPTVGGVNPLEEKSLLDIILPPGGIRINLSSPLGKLLVGNINNDIGNPDSGKNVIEKLKEKIKSSYSQLEINDPPSIGGNTAAAIERRKKIKQAFESLPPNPTEIEKALDEMFSIATKAIDDIKVSSIKFPKDDKKLLSPVLGPGEIIDNLNKAIDTVTSAPAALQSELLKILGIQIPTIDIKKKIREQVLQQVDTANIRNFFKEIDQKIAEIEGGFTADTDLDEKIRERVKVIKDLAKKPLQEAAKKISPEILGFAAKAVDMPVLPFPCYKNIELPAVPSYIYVLIAAFKAAPSIIDALPLEQVANLVSFEIDLSKTLPSAEKLFYNTINGLLDSIPDLKLPNPDGDTMLKQVVDMVKQIPLKFKVHLPGKIGLPSQIVIPGSLVKTLMKEAAKIAFDVIKGMLMGKIYEAIASENTQKVIAVSLIIKALFGVSLSEIKGSDIKSFIGGILDSTVYPALDGVSSLINTINALGSFPFLSIIELFQFPPKLSLPGKDGPFYDVSWELLKPILDPLINSVLPLLFKNTPLIVVLLACSFSVSRLAFTKLHPTKPFERIPTWEGLSDKNIPFVIWLDQLVATAQRKSGLGSTYLVATGYQAIP